jgi:hypothetical protein
MNDFKLRWSGLSKRNKLSLLAMLTPLLTLPFAVYLLLIGTNFRAAAFVPFVAESNLINNNPVMATEILPIASVGEYYYETIEGYDLDVEDELEFAVDSLPDGLRLGSCERMVEVVNNFETALFIVCEIEGMVTEEGLYEVEAVISDSAGATVTKIFNLQAE